MSDIGTKNFIDELVKTSKFTEDEARTYVNLCEEGYAEWSNI